MATSLVQRRSSGNRCLNQVLVIGFMSVAGVLLGWVPSLDWQPSSLFGVNLSFETAAYAQSAVSDSEVRSYAASVRSIEPIRQSAYDQIKAINGSVPPILCHRSLNDLPSSIRPIAVDYCNQAIQIVERNGLTITRFNEITVYRQSDASLERRVQSALGQ